MLPGSALIPFLLLLFCCLYRYHKGMLFNPRVSSLTEYDLHKDLTKPGSVHRRVVRIYRLYYTTGGIIAIILGSCQAETISRDQIFKRRERRQGQGNINFPCSADHEQDWQPYPVDPYSAVFVSHVDYPLEL